MKKIIVIGSRDKTDFLLYLSQLLVGLDQKVLLVDATKKALYKNGYTHLTENEHFYDFHGIDILTDCSNNQQINERLQQYEVSIQEYDFVFIDIDDKEFVSADWGQVYDRFYVGDYEVSTMKFDAHLISKYIQTHQGQNEFKRITYYLNTLVNDEYFDQLVVPPVVWTSTNILIEFDEVDMENKINTQFRRYIEFKRLSSGFKEALTQVASILTECHSKDVKQLFTRK